MNRVEYFVSDCFVDLRDNINDWAKSNGNTILNTSVVARKSDYAVLVVYSKNEERM